MGGGRRSRKRRQRAARLSVIGAPVVGTPPTTVPVTARVTRVTDPMVTSELERFLANYGETELMQPSAAAPFDSQIRNLSPLIAQFITEHSTSTIVDIGAGTGILLQRLSEIDAFKAHATVMYIGVDFPEKLDDKLVERP